MEKEEEEEEEEKEKEDEEREELVEMKRGVHKKEEEKVLREVRQLKSGKQKLRSL